ncbi:hypothetical protein CY34DRAFT_19400 [Suillus luteus UH-Slu-Lm8-n1]|uniref:Uncharacterized protein n=1 Tax=Suillus luteus UH-Slu-Lm8-n1 TaxID=930992 RepID=A0A0D0A1F8_9AGAM|nr:hypothetical protein CY34DRAFT_19400 [Suillus luteus UH-Slu-Lm8-n1]
MRRSVDLPTPQSQLLLLCGDDTTLSVPPGSKFSIGESNRFPGALSTLQKHCPNSFA